MKIQSKKPVCAYCGLPGSSREHVYGAWLTRLFPDDRRANRMGYSFEHGGPKTVKVTPYWTPTKTGAFLNLQTRAVCGGCNRGWMADIQSNASVLVPRLAEPQLFELTAKMQHELALWAVMASMSAELTYSGRTITQPQDRAKFKEHGVVPMNWRVAIARYLGAEFSLQSWNTIFFVNTPPLGAHGQLTLMLLGTLVVITLSAETAEAVDECLQLVLLKDRFFRIAPSTSPPPRWPELHVLGDVEIRWIVDRFRQPPKSEAEGHFFETALKIIGPA